MISQMLGIESDYIIIGLVAVTLIMFIMLMVNMAQMLRIKASATTKSSFYIHTN